MPDERAVTECIAEISKRISGSCRSDAWSRMFYATDASIYQVQPLGVVIPRDREDVQLTVETAARFGVPLLPRAAGSSLAGQAVGEAIVVDFTRHLDRIIEIDSEAATVRAEPGVVLGVLNAKLKSHGLKFGPDPASADRATMGGIVANNSTGAHSILYGMTADHVESMNVILSDGSRARFGPTNLEGGFGRSGADSLEDSIYMQIGSLLETPGNRDVIRSGTPKHWRRCGGYNLDRLVHDGISFRLPQDPGLNLARLIAGSEGTLAVIEDVTLGLVPLPRSTSLAIVHFNSLATALEAVSIILETDPSAVELLDHVGMSMCRKVPAWRRILEGFVEGDPECVLITEYYGETETETRSKVEALADMLQRNRCGAETVVPVLDPVRQAEVWGVRKMGLGFLMSVRGDHKPIPFIEDAAVPIEHLAEYVTGLESFCRDLDTRVAYYAHASAGCVHIRPMVNTKSAEEIAKLPEITGFAIELLKGFGGALSSEHGDGRARSAFNEQFFGSDLYGLFRDVKRIFDLDHMLNPGNIVDASPMTGNLRFGPEYRTVTVETHFDFSDDGGFDRAVEMCNGAGVCRKLSAGTMCPSFMATREEEHSTRGRANALRAVLSGRIEADGLGDRRLYETMDLCLACKACASECPSSVDMAKLKMEFLAQYQDIHGVSRRTRLFAGVAKQARLLSGATGGVATVLMQTAPVRFGMKALLGIAKQRTMPPFTRRPFTEWYRDHVSAAHGTPALGAPAEIGSGAATSSLPARDVVLFNDTFNTYNYPQVAIAATQFLEAAGFKVHLPGHRCCGRPALSKGLLEEARQFALSTVDALAPFVEQGIPIVGLEPSCLLSFGDEYPSLLPEDDRVKQIAENSFLFEDFVVNHAEGMNLRFDGGRRDLLVHGHCHQKSSTGMKSTLEALDLPENYSVREIDSGCCGMAGSFGFESEHYDLSMAIGEQRLFPAVREAPDGTCIVASGVSCRQQIEHGTGRRAMHPAEVLWEALSHE